MHDINVVFNNEQSLKATPAFAAKLEWISVVLSI